MSAARSDVLIYHNPRCSKSRSALELLRTRGIEPQVIEYLRTPLDERELADLLSRLGLPASALLRRKEALFKRQYGDRELTEAECLKALATHPELLERPIVVRGEHGVLARPPERVLDLL